MALWPVGSGNAQLATSGNDCGQIELSGSLETCPTPTTNGRVPLKAGGRDELARRRTLGNPVDLGADSRPERHRSDSHSTRSHVMGGCDSQCSITARRCQDTNPKRQRGALRDLPRWRFPYLMIPLAQVPTISSIHLSGRRAGITKLPASE